MRKTVLVLLLFLGVGYLLPAQSWQRIESEHTLIIFEERDASYAHSLALFADEVFLELATLLDHKPKRKVPVILAGRPAVANGMYSSFPSSIILYLTSPVDRFLGNRSASWLRSLYTHELTHYLHLTAPVGPAKYLFFFGPEVPSMNTALMPLWWVEGITTYTESEYALGGRGDSPLFALTWQSPLLKDSLWTLSQGRYNSYNPPRGRIYSTGYLMVDYLMRTYGKESFARVNETFTWFPFLGLNRALRRETGFTSKELFSLVIEEQRSSISDAPAQGEKLSFQGVGDYYLPISTAEGLVGYAHTYERGGALVRYDLAGKVEHLISLPSIEPRSIALSSSQAVFASLWSDPFHPSSLALAPVSYSDLYLYNFEADSFSRITEKGMFSQPIFSAAGGEHLFAIQRTGDRHRLVTLDSNTGFSSPLYENRLGSLFEPVLIDEHTVVVVEVVQGNSSLVAIDTKGGKTTLVPPTQSEIRSPSYSEGRLLFVSDDSGFLSLYSYDFVTEEVSLLLSDPQGVLSARIEGDTVLYEIYDVGGVALKQTLLAHLSPSVVQLQEPTMGERMSVDKEQPLYSSTGFVDYPRLNVVLPFPFVSENSVQPGVWFHSQSLLRRQSLIGQGGWDIANKRAVGSFLYSYNPGPYLLALEGSFAASQQVRASLSFPLLYTPSLFGFRLLSLQGSVGFTVQDSSLLYPLALRLRYQKREHGRPKDFFGASYRSISLGAESIAKDSLIPYRIRFSSSLEGQKRLFSTSQMLLFAFDLVTDSKGILSDALLYQGFSYPGLDGEAKARFTLRYHIPFGLLDQPIPYGGLTGMGLTLSAATALYSSGSALSWDREVVFAGKLTALTVLGSGLEVRPFASLAYSVAKNRASFSVGLTGGSSLVVGGNSLL